MSKIKRIIAGATIASYLLFGGNTIAQDNKRKIILPTKAAIESSIISNKDMDGILMQRIETGNDDWTLRYDYNSKLNFDKKPANVGMLSLNSLYDKNNINVGAEVFQVGNLDGKDTWFVDAWASKKYKKTSFMIDAGLGFPSTKYLQTYAIASFNHPKTTIKGAFYNVSSKETRYYGYISYHNHNIYASVGNKINTGFAIAGTYGFKSFGNMTFGTLDRKTGDIWIKSQTAIDNVNQKFYSAETFDLASDILSMPMFQPIHLNPVSTKGNYALKLEYKYSETRKSHETEVMLATKKIPFIELGVGVNTEYKENCTNSSFALELFKEVRFGKFSGSAEARYNHRTKTGTAYIKMSRTF